MSTIELNGRWQILERPLEQAGLRGLAGALRCKRDWLPARVPGEVHLDLMRAGRMEEPLVSTNAQESRWPEQKSWWYRRTFTVPKRLLGMERLQLVFEGIDLYGQVFVNGCLVGECANAFVPAVFDVRNALRQGRNELVVRVTCGGERVPADIPRTPAEPDDLYDNRQWGKGVRLLRKPQFSYGWDWIDALPNIGIWRPVRLEGRSWAVIHDLRLDTVLHGDDVMLEMEAVVENLHPWSSRRCTLELTIQPPKGRAVRHKFTINAQTGRQSIHEHLAIDNPQMWWPNGMGEQPLYQVTARLLGQDGECDRREFAIGLRTVEIDRSPLPKGGERFCVRVNGQDVFCRGGNWIPADAILARVDARKYERLIEEAAGANFNMLRIWGGGIYEDPAFYEACDRAGILVWQDFMFACSTYPDESPDFRRQVRDEAEAAVRRLRHHPCLALWCGNNENVWAFANWWNDDKDAFANDLDLGGHLLYNHVLPETCRALDPHRPYWPGSPFGGVEPNSEDEGDCHWWHQSTMHPDVNRRISHEIFDECRARFVSEYGIIGPVHFDSCKRFLKPDERVRDSRAWKTHTNTFEERTTPAAIRHHYADPEDLSIRQYILHGQLFQACMYGRSLEALRFRKQDPRDDCAGALIWMFNDCWGEVGWTPIDYYLRRKPSYYWIRNALRPIKCIVRRRGRQMVTRVVNDTLKPCSVTVSAGWRRLDGTAQDVRAHKVEVPANSMVEVCRESIPAGRKRPQDEWLYAAVMQGRTVAPDQSAWLFQPLRTSKLGSARIRIARDGDRLTLQSDVFVHAVHVDDRGKAVLSDNYFDLLPGVGKTITCAEIGKRRLSFKALLQRAEITMPAGM
jgi:beta-mannosidase